MKRILILGVIACACQADAIDLFSNFGPGETYSNGGFGIWGTQTTGVNSAAAGGFTSGGSAAVGRLRMGLLQRVPGVVRIQLRTDSGGVFGSVLETWTISSAPTEFGSSLVLESVGHPILTAGQNYWITAEPTDNTAATSYVWFGAAPDSVGPFAQINGVFGQQWTYYNQARPAFAVEAVPEPATLAILTCGLGLLTRRSRRERR